MNEYYFDVTWRRVCSVREVDYSVVREIVNNMHHLKSAPRACAKYAMYYFDRVVGAALFSKSTGLSQRYGGGSAIILSRLYVYDFVPQNVESWLIGKAIRLVRKKYPDLRYIVAYCDPLMHVGTVYKASGFVQDGSTQEGRRIPRKSYYRKDGSKLHAYKSIKDVNEEIYKLPKPNYTRFVRRLK